MIQDVRLDLKLRPWFWFCHLSDLLLMELCGCETEQERVGKRVLVGAFMGRASGQADPDDCPPSTAGMAMTLSSIVKCAVTMNKVDC